MTSVKFIPVCSVSSGDFSNVKKITQIDELSWKLPYDREVSPHHSSKSSNLSLMKMETQTMYFTDPGSKLSGLIQILYSKVLGNLHKGFQVNFKVFSHDQRKNDEYQVWLSTHISGMDFVKGPPTAEDGGKYYSFIGAEGKGVKVYFSEIPAREGGENSKGIKYVMDINIPKEGLSIKLESVLGEGFCIQPDGCSYFFEHPVSSADIAKLKESPTASKKFIRHMFIPSGKCNGIISYMNQSGTRKEITLWEAPILYIDATQTLLPSRAVSRWNFLCFKGSNYTAMVMEYLTTAEFGSVRLSLWSISKGDRIIDVGSQVNDDDIVQFIKTKMDTKNKWQYPTAVTFKFPNSSHDELIADDLHLVKAFSILDELPTMVRQVARKIMDMHPFLYQHCQKAKFRGEDGVAFVETTFVS